jgi:hypothetical protein
LVGLVVLGLGLVSLVWASSGPNAGRDSEVALNAHPSIEVLEEPFLSFEPAEADVGLVLFPDTRVQAAAYAPLARILAERGVLVAVVRPWFRVPFLSPDAPSAVFEYFPDIEKWVVGGHGAGGKLAARYAGNHPDVSGLVLLGALSSERTDLSESNLAALSIVGSDDGFVSVIEVEGSSSRMPMRFKIIPIDGANHAFFGDYGEIGLDGEATITASAQRNRAAQEIERFVRGL